MTPESVFVACNLFVVPGWLLLLLAPRWRWTSRVCRVWIPTILALVYCVALGIAVSSDQALGGFGTLGAVRQLFENSWALLAGWIHYLAFDLFVGAWQLRDCQRRQIPHLRVVPSLVLTFLAGPVGLLTYFAISRGRGLT